jgi:threonine dehydratase
MVDLSDVQDAARRIRDLIHRTPVATSRTLNGRLKAEVFLKCENLQRVGAFKFRGACHALSRLSPEQRRRGVITHSSGNHAQALALAARLQSVRAVIVMPEGAPAVKVRATRDSYGAEVVFCENNQESRQETTRRLIERHGYALIHPYDNDHIIAGAGTAALELLEEVPDLDTIVAPVGGGGLLSGTSTAARGLNPRMRVLGAEPERADDARRSLASGRIEGNERPDTIADGLRTTLSERTFTIIRQRVDDIVTVAEPDIIEAMRFLWERMKLVVEPSGAVPLAALLAGRIPAEKRRIGLIASGGNVDLDGFFEALGRRVV